MSNIITSQKIAKHNVDKYTFKVLSLNNAQETKEDKEPEQTSDAQLQPLAPIEKKEIDATQMASSSKDSLIESLLKKTDEMSSNFIKLQMKLENMTEEHKNELQKVEKDSFAKGVEEGKALALKESEKKSEESLALYAESVEKLQKNADEFVHALEGIKKELISAALDIAHEVIKIELSENSNEVVKILSQELIKELQSASKVRLRVNPKDHTAVSEKVGSLEHVEIISDSAVSLGGVVAMSDAGNIDAQIAKRFERVKKAALSE